jgi:hypothetical protein
MDYNFVITLKRPDYKLINWVSVLLIITFLLAFFFHITQTGIGKSNMAILGIPVIIIGLMLNGFFRRKQKDFLVYYRVELLIAALGWFVLPLFADVRFIGWLYGLMAFIERYVKMPDQWAFSKDHVVRNVFPKKTYEWVDIDNAVIRDNLFTLDLRSNKIIQKELETPVDQPLQDEFNEFCQQQLHFTNTSQ